MTRPEFTYSAETFEDMAGRPLTDEELYRIIDAIHHSSVPEAVGEVVFSAVGYSDEG